MELLKPKFLEQYDDAPAHMNELGAFVFYRTYSRWLESEGRRETWKEAVRRAVEYSVSITNKQMKQNNKSISVKGLQTEAETLFDNIYNLRQFLSGRTHWVGGANTKVAEKFALSNFNCSFLNISSWNDFSDLFYLLLVGTGVGFKSTKKLAKNMHPVRRDFKIIHQPFTQRYPFVKVENTETFYTDNQTKAVIHIGDSKEGFVESLRQFFEIITDKNKQGIKTISIHYDYIRPKGTKLKTFGGTASGYEPVQEMFEGIEKVLKGNMDPFTNEMETQDDKWFQPRPIHMLDIGNLIGNNVVSGGVRRSAEIFLCDSDDWECILAKYGINGLWDEYGKNGSVTRTAKEKHQEVVQKMQKAIGYTPAFMKHITFNDPNARPLHHRRMSNNTIVFEKKPPKNILDLMVTLMKNEGEPGIFNMEAALERRPHAEGMNPCAEILLDTYGVCNLTTINIDAFVIYNQQTGKYELDMNTLLAAQKLSTRAGVRMTCLDLELPHWDKVQKRDRLIGTSLTGWYDAMDKLEYDANQEKEVMQALYKCSKAEAVQYAAFLNIPEPLLTTTIKPEGTLSQVAGGVSSGLHRSHSEYYIRRIRINAEDPLAKAAKELNWTIHADVGTEGFITQNDLARPDVISKARTLVVDFPVFSGAKTTKDDVYVEEQFNTYFRFQENYTAHNSSNTIHVRPYEWGKVRDIIWNNWDRFIATSFLPYDGGSYTLAPYESITKEQYETIRASMKDFNPSILQQYENSYLDKEMAMSLAEGCESGACPVI